MKFESLSYCGRIVREHDPDRFFLSMFVPADRREAVWALLAFNHEIAKTREVVSETQLGLIRLQWWRDRIGEIYAHGAVPEHEGLKALAAAIAGYGLEQDLFETLIYAREFDLEDVVPGTMEGTLKYADLTSTPLFELIMQVLGADGRDPVQAVATNYALAGILRAVPAFAAQKRCLLPQDRMQAYGVKLNQLYEGKAQGGLKKVVQETSEAFVSGIACENRYLRAAQKMAEVYMGQIKRRGYDVFDPKLRYPPALKELRVFLDL